MVNNNNSFKLTTSSFKFINAIKKNGKAYQGMFQCINESHAL